MYWAFERIAELWKPYQRSIVHRSALVACVTHTLHARLMLNHYVETRASGDFELLVRNDLAQLARLPDARIADVQIARTRARLALLRGDRAQAIGLLRSALNTLEVRRIRQEREHDQYALGMLLGGAEGEELVAVARNEMSKCGIVDPDATMRAYAPELFR